MRLEKLRVQGLRCLEEAALSLAPGINVFIGPNGAGKTSVLEAAFLLSHARSFRVGAKDALLRRGAESVAVFAELRHDDERPARIGLGRRGARWEAKIDASRVMLGELLRECAVVCFEPGSHALIAGGAEERRRYLDWGVFHVEPDFLATWRRYQRALKQRNSLLRAGASPGPGEIAPWETEMAAAAAWIDRQRHAYLDRLRPLLTLQARKLLPELGAVDLRYRRGWPEGEGLAESLVQARVRDAARGHTTLGAHRADWTLSFAHAPWREHLSRGQEKLAALSCTLAQAALYAEGRGEWPIICLDDLASELDLDHQGAVVDQLAAAGAQVMVTGTDLPPALQTLPHRLFHVEQGQITALL
jgi:DNA replication and repair protein RecF